MCIVFYFAFYHRVGYKHCNLLQVPGMVPMYNRYLAPCTVGMVPSSVDGTRRMARL